mgnify:CR=1 FL=1
MITNWNNAVSHISDAIKHITSTERTTWNTVTSKVDKVDGKSLISDTEITRLAGVTNYTLPTASTTVKGGIKVGANLNIDANGILSANSNPSSFIIKQEKFIATDGQTVFNLTKGSYEPNANRIFWYWNRVKQTNDALTETSSTSFTLASGVISAGDEIVVEYIELINSDPYPIHAPEHLTGGLDAIPTATTSTDGLMSSSDKTRLNGIATGAEVNQNAFSNIKVGATTVSADSKTDTLELVAGTGITLTPDATNDKITITGVNQYVHPDNHPANMITEDSTHRFVTDTERTNWDTSYTNNHTHSNKSVLDLVSGTNPGNETTTTVGNLINGATAKTTPVDADMIGLMDSGASNVLKKLSWANIKATLK